MTFRTVSTLCTLANRHANVHLSQSNLFALPPETLVFARRENPYHLQITTEHAARKLNLVRKLLVLVVGLTATATAQQSQQPPPAKSWQFEVATIKPGDPNSLGSSASRAEPGREARLVNMPLKQWVETALSVQDYALKEPAWLDTSRFDMLAKVPVDAPRDHDLMPEMLRALLIERFGLKWHEEFQSMSGFTLVADKKLLAKPASGQGGGVSRGHTYIDGSNMTMATFAETLREVLGKPVVDATHLSGAYDMKLRWRSDNEAEVAWQRENGKQNGYDVDNLPDTVFTAIREQLGLRLLPARVPTKVVVVDNINREPTPN